MKDCTFTPNLKKQTSKNSIPKRNGGNMRSKNEKYKKKDHDEIEGIYEALTQNQQLVTDY